MGLGSNKHLLVKVSKACGQLGERFVFIGGSIVEFLITDPGSPGVRGTKDVDVILEVASLLEYNDFEAELRKLGFKQDLSDDPPVICRWLVDGVQVDVMPTDEGILGFRNRWYPTAID